MSKRGWRSIVAAVMTTGLMLSVSPAATSAPKQSVPDPTVTAPEPGLKERPFGSNWFDLAPYGFVEEEWFLSGTARTIAAVPALAPYATRVLVTRPVDPKRFNGTVIVEWENVTVQMPLAPDWAHAHPMILREGYAHVRVSAQSAGICCSPLSLKGWDPVRYLPLSHPGDDFSFDIFSQALQAVRHPAGVDILGGLKVKKVLAAGQSQSASRMYSYIENGAHAGAGLADGFLIDAGGGKQFSRPLDAPVLHLLTEREMTPGAATTDPNYRLWEVAGSSHGDWWSFSHGALGQGQRDVLGQPPAPAGSSEKFIEEHGGYGEDRDKVRASCATWGEFPRRYSVRAAIVQLDRWVRTGVPAPAAPRIQFRDGAIERDEHGNALGGLRLPPIDFPVATYTGDDCGLLGSTSPFSDAKLAELYPSHDNYVRRMQEATDVAVAAGYLLPKDARELMGRAEASVIGR